MGSGHVCRSRWLMCPHADMPRVRTCRPKEELNGKAEGVILASNARTQTSGSQAYGEAPLRKSSKRASKISGDHTRLGRGAPPAPASKKRVQTSLYTSRSRRRVPAPWSAHRHGVPSPKQDRDDFDDLLDMSHRIPKKVKQICLFSLLIIFVVK